jgi:hypothetical protein
MSLGFRFFHELAEKETEAERNPTETNAKGERLSVILQYLYILIQSVILFGGIKQFVKAFQSVLRKQALGNLLLVVFNPVEHPVILKSVS